MVVIDESALLPAEPVTDAELDELESYCVCKCDNPRCKAVVVVLMIRELRLRRRIAGQGS